MSFQSGRHFLQIPGPTNVPDRILRAIDRPTIDHRGPDFKDMVFDVLDGLKSVFKTSGRVIVYPASGTGAWEASLVNTLSPGDRVLMCETGHFSTLWSKLATRIGLDVEVIAGDWRCGADPDAIGRRLADDRDHAVKAVCLVHNETSPGVQYRLADLPNAIQRPRHPPCVSPLRSGLYGTGRVSGTHALRRGPTRRFARGAQTSTPGPRTA